MKKLLPALFFISAFIVSLGLSSCKKDETCRAHINVVNALGQKQKNVWVRIDIAPGTPAGNFTDRVPIQLNTLQDGFVDVEFKLPAILDAAAYDSTNTQFAPPALGHKILQLVPGETVNAIITVP